MKRDRVRCAAGFRQIPDPGVVQAIQAIQAIRGVDPVDPRDVWAHRQSRQYRQSGKKGWRVFTGLRCLKPPVNTGVLWRDV